MGDEKIETDSLRTIQAILGGPDLDSIVCIEVMGWRWWTRASTDMRWMGPADEPERVKYANMAPQGGVLIYNPQVPYDETTQGPREPEQQDLPMWSTRQDLADMVMAEIAKRLLGDEFALAIMDVLGYDKEPSMFRIAAATAATKCRAAVLAVRRHQAAEAKARWDAPLRECPCGATDLRVDSMLVVVRNVPVWITPEGGIGYNDTVGTSQGWEAIPGVRVACQKCRREFELAQDAGKHWSLKPIERRVIEIGPRGSDEEATCAS